MPVSRSDPPKLTRNSFKYDPFGRRIYKSSSSGTSIFAYDGDDLTEETNSTGAVVARYEPTQNIDEPLAMLRSSATSYYHADGLGSVTSLSNAAGSIANTYTYDSFGELTASTGSLVNPFQYTARESDTETGLYYYRARYYDSQLGRFISEDPIRHAGGIDFYAFTYNRPTNLTDPSGRIGDPAAAQALVDALIRLHDSIFLPNGGFKYYGNWGGPGWTGGSLIPYEDMTAEERAKLLPAIDNQDECYKQHDLCYSNARVRNHCTFKAQPTPKQRQAQ